jgi:hypothetical protein
MDEKRTNWLKQEKCGHLRASDACGPATRFFMSRWFRVPMALCGKHAIEITEMWAEETDGLREISQQEFEDLTMVGEVHLE